MDLSAVRGALGFLSRVPVGRDERAWEAFGHAPASLVVAGYVVGALVAGPVAVTVWMALPAPTVAVVLIAAVVLVAGVNHADGLADLGDAAVVHGGPDDRRAVMHDTTVGVGGTVALGTVLLALALAGLSLASVPALTVVGLLVAAEVGAKLGVALLACVGDPSHDGLGARLATGATARDAVVACALAAPALALTGRSVVAAVAITAAVAGGLAVGAWATHRIGGVSGDVFGAANEVGRVVALHAGVIAWTLS